MLKSQFSPFSAAPPLRLWPTLAHRLTGTNAQGARYELGRLAPRALLATSARALATTGFVLAGLAPSAALLGVTVRPLLGFIRTRRNLV